MDNKKSKKKLFAIIGSSVLAFVLTVVVSVAVTLAYFGDKVEGNADLTMQGAVDLGSAITVESTTTDPILPGATITASGEVKVAATTGTPTDFVVALQVKALNEEGTESALVKNTVLKTFMVGSTEYGLQEVDGVYYVVAKGAAEDNDLLQVITGTTAEQTITFVAQTEIDKDLNNDYALEKITVKVEVIAMQSFAIDASADNKLAPTISGSADTILAQSAWTQA